MGRLGIGPTAKDHHICRDENFLAQSWYKNIIDALEKCHATGIENGKEEGLDQLKNKVAPLMKMLARDDLQHCFSQCKIRMLRCLDKGGTYGERVKS